MISTVTSRGNWSNSRVVLCVASCFFFQAEDGIRDYKVTGVQTCALPIFLRFLRRRRYPTRPARTRGPSAGADGARPYEHPATTSGRQSGMDESGVGKRQRDRKSVV